MDMSIWGDAFSYALVEERLKDKAGSGLNKQVSNRVWNQVWNESENRFHFLRMRILEQMYNEVTE